MSVTAEAPRWNLDFLFPSVDSPEFRSAEGKVLEEMGRLEALFDGLDIRAGGAGADPGAALSQVLTALNEFIVLQRRIFCYLSALVTTDSSDAVAQAKLSELQAKMTPFAKLMTRLTAWIGEQDEVSLIESSTYAKEHAWVIRKAALGSKHLMSPLEEALASDLSLSGSTAWTKLHGNMTSQLEVELNGEKLSMSVIRTKAYDPERDVRRDAYMAELDAWKKVEVPLAACMNGVKGETVQLSKKRGWSSPLEMACFNANIDVPTLEAMMSAAEEAFPDFRRYLDAKAKMLGLQKLAFFDIFAPVGSEERHWEFDEAADFVCECFGGFSQKLKDYAASEFNNRRIDAEPRAGKRDGAYCMGVPPTDSLIMMNFKPAFGAVSTLAHELGHGYHNLCLRERTMLQRSTPMTLAETASIFCETIIRQAVLQSDASDQEKLSVLEASLQGSCQTVVDISSRFFFEQTVFEKRANRDLSPAELNEAMIAAQMRTYGDGLDSEFLHPYMWAAKPHYYGSTYYNFPYMFGLLFGLGLYTIYESDRDGFKLRYDDLLSSTGLDDAATLAGGFGIDIRSPEFWRGSLNQVRADIDRFLQFF